MAEKRFLNYEGLLNFTRQIASKFVKAADFLAHKNDATAHTTSTDKSHLNTAYEHSQTKHAPADAQKNTITGVKGDAEESYRTGNINLTPANIGAVSQQQNAENSGKLLGIGADGNVVPVEAPDTGATNHLYRKAIFLGDSTSYGYDNDGYSFVDIFAENGDFQEVVKLATGGATLGPYQIASSASGKSCIEQIQNNLTEFDDADLVFIQFCVNDLECVNSGKVSMVNLNGSQDGSILGHSQTIIETIYERNPYAKICFLNLTSNENVMKLVWNNKTDINNFILLHKMWNEYVMSYWASNNIPIINILDGINFNSFTANEYMITTSDGSHLNTAGNQNAYRRIKASIDSNSDATSEYQIREYIIGIEYEGSNMQIEKSVFKEALEYARLGSNVHVLMNNTVIIPLSEYGDNYLIFSKLNYTSDQAYILLIHISSNGSVEITTHSLSGGGTLPSDYETVKKNAQNVWINQTLTYSIENNRSEIFAAVENSKSRYLAITDGSEYWDAEEAVKYPEKLSMDQIRRNRFYANMWLPNGLDMDQAYRYAVDKNGQIRLYNINGQKSDLASFLPWGMCLKGQGKSFPSTAVNFVVSNIKVLGLNNKTKCWELALDTAPNGSLYIVQQTNLETEITYDVARTVLGDGLYQFTVQPNQWHYSNPDSEYDGYDTCFHFFGTEGILVDQMKQYDKLLVCFRMAIQEEAYSDVFTVSAGGDAWGTVETITEAFFGRFNPVTNTLLEYNANNCLENEANLISDHLTYIDELLSDNGEGGGSSGSSYVLPVMSEIQLGGGKAVAKTTETVPVAVDASGKLWVPDQSEGGSQPGTTTTPYDNKTIVMFGDSIVAGWGWEDGKGITEPLREKYPLATWVNKAISGANMAEKSGASHASILSTVKGYMGEADYILLEGGTNDVNNGVPMGDAAAGYDASYNESSFCGALESALQIINDRYPLARKLFLVPHSFAKDNSYLDSIHDKAIEICGKWNVPVLDMRDMAQIAMTNANKARYTRNPNTNQGDGVHPTETWYRAFYCPVVDQFMRSLGQYDGDVEPPENVPVTGVTLDQSAITLTSAGQTQQLQATVQPSNATNKSLTWESDHPEIASVDQTGRVTAKTEGTATITVKTVDGNKTATCTVNVNISIQPEDHTELPKITIDKDCYFDTDVAPSVNSKLEIKVKVNDPEIDGTWVFGVRDSKNKYTLSITNNWYCTRGSITSAAGAHDYWAGSGKAWVISQEGNVFDFDGDKVTLADVSALDFGTSAYIGNANNNGSPYTGAGFNGDFYYCHMYSGDSMNAEIVPVKKKDGTLCLYDKINGRYLYNLGTGSLRE